MGIRGLGGNAPSRCGAQCNDLQLPDRLCEKRRLPERALELLEAVQRHGVIPDVITYSSLIGTCRKSKQPERALELLDSMQRQGVVPNVII